MNRICLVGRLTRDPESRTTTTGKNYSTFSVAVNKRVKPQDPNERDADFFNVKVWGQAAQYVDSYLTKGRLVSVEGRIESRRYTDQQGVQREIWEVTADNVQGLDRPKEEQPAQTTTAPPDNADHYDPFADE